mgnify:CR=1 FL=1
MIGFVSKIKIERISASRWVTLDDLVFEIHDFASITVPMGTDTDGTSVPRFARSLVSIWGNNSEAAVMHDYLYQMKVVPRIIADSLFMVALFVSDVKQITTYTMFFAVRFFGKKAWNSHK